MCAKERYALRIFQSLGWSGEDLSAQSPGSSPMTAGWLTSFLREQTARLQWPLALCAELVANTGPQSSIGRATAAYVYFVARGCLCQGVKPVSPLRCFVPCDACTVRRYCRSRKSTANDTASEMSSGVLYCGQTWVAADLNIFF